MTVNDRRTLVWLNGLSLGLPGVPYAVEPEIGQLEGLPQTRTLAARTASASSRTPARIAGSDICA